jgi:hypothetical protein
LQSQPAAQPAAQPAKPRPAVMPTSGWITFAGVMTIVTGALNALDGFIAIYRTSYFRNLFVYGNLRFWSVVLLVFGAVQILAGFAIMAGRGWGRWFGIITVTVNAFLQLSLISAYPFSASIIIAYDIAIFYALAARWRTRPTLAASS